MTEQKSKLKSLFEAETIDTPVSDAVVVEDISQQKEDEKNSSIDNQILEILEPETKEGEIKPTSVVNVFKRSLLTSNGLTLKGQRLLRVVLSLISPNDKEGKVYSFNTEDYKYIYGIEEHSTKQLKDAGKELTVPRDFNFSDDPDGFTISGLISYLSVQNGVATFAIAPPLLPFYNDVKKMQQYLLGYVRTFESRYSFSFYELFLEKLAEEGENTNGLVFYMSIAKLRQWLKIEDKYQDSRTGMFAYNNFKVRVLEPVMRDINKKDELEQCACDINFSFEAKRQGRTVVGIEFKVWRTNAKPIEEPKVNPFYESLEPDVRLRYDMFLKLSISQQAIEKAILTFGANQFIKISNFGAKVKYKGPAYIAAILRNGITNATYTGQEDFTNIEKLFILGEAKQKRYHEAEDFLTHAEPGVQDMVFAVTKNALSKQPLIFKHIVNMSLEELLKTNDLKVFFLERLVDIIVNAENKSVLKAYQDYFSGIEKKTEEFKTERKIVEQFIKYSIHPSRWRELLAFSDEHIMANIMYCTKRYRNLSNPYDMAALMVKAIKEDYDQFEIKKRETELEAAKQKEEAERAEAMQKALGGTETSSDKPVKTDANKDAELAFEMAFESFLIEASAEEKEQLKATVLIEAKSTQKLLWSRSFKVKEEKLSEIPFDTFITNFFFKIAAKTVYKKELGL